MLSTRDPPANNQNYIFYFPASGSSADITAIRPSLVRKENKNNDFIQQFSSI